MRKDRIYQCYKKYILDEAILTFPPVRKREYSLQYYLDNFIHVLNDLTKWKSLKLIHPHENKYHWKTIYNEFVRWSNHDVFVNAYYKFIATNYFKLANIKKSKKLNIFVDVTKISNLGGSEKIAINPEYKKKNVTSLSFACDENKIAIGASCLDTNLNKTSTGRHTSVHELKGLQNTLDNIPFNVKSYVKVEVAADKAYITQNKFNVLGRTKKIITPKRANQKTKNTKNEKKLLGKRHKIENMFAPIKRNVRIYVRRDKKIHTYMSFVYIILFEQVCKFANKIDTS